MSLPGDATPFGRTLYPLGLLAWLAAFAWVSFGVARAAGRLWRETEGVETEAAALNAGALRLQALSRRTVSQAEEARFLQDLPDPRPDDKGYLRTQRAIAGEVAQLRAKVGRRLRGALQVVVDAKANKLYLKKGLKLLWQADVSVGRGGLLADRKSGQRWMFVTPRGVFRVIGKGRDPKWRKPDWAFVEEGEPVPPPNDPSRFVDGELGAYFLNLGDGYLIHGTKNEKTLGRPASHGCVRVGAADLERLYKEVPVGTKVYIFQ